MYTLFLGEFCLNHSTQGYKWCEYAVVVALDQAWTTSETLSHLY
jgi:hypothetical protein